MCLHSVQSGTDSSDEFLFLSPLTLSLITIIAPLSLDLAEMLKSSQELKDLTLVVSTMDDDHENDLSSSYPMQEQHL